MKIGLFIKYEVVDKSFEESIKKKIMSFGYSIDNSNPDYVFSFGGDGTFLKAVQKYLSQLDHVKFVCVNKGKLGFFCDFKEEELDEILSNLDGDKYSLSSYRLLTARINNEDIFAVNEVRIENPFHTLTSEVLVNGSELETFRGNGLVVCSAIGSSAYNKSLGGALLDSALEVMQIKEIAPISNCLYTSLINPLVVPSTSKITFKGNFKEVVLGYDHLTKKELSTSEITISLSDKKVKIVSKKDRDYIKKINSSFLSRR